MIEKSAGAVVFRKEDNKIYYLLLYCPSLTRRAEKNYWDFPKGHIEKGETIEETTKREIKEETGLTDIEIIPNFKETIKYYFRWDKKKILKFVTFFLAQSKKKKIKISKEHIGFDWLPYEKTMERLTHKSTKEILKKANNYLKKYVTFS